MFTNMGGGNNQAFGNCAFQRMWHHVHHVHGQCKLFCNLHWWYLDKGVVVSIEIKKGVFWEFEEFKAFVERHKLKGTNLKHFVRTMADSLFLKDCTALEGLWHQKSNIHPIHTSTNGVTKCANCIIMEMARNIFHAQNLNNNKSMSNEDVGLHYARENVEWKEVLHCIYACIWTPCVCNGDG